MNGYICFYKNKQFEIYANTTLEARNKCAKENRIKKDYEITVMLAEKDGKQLEHVATF